jgi:hypothetical protein
MGFVSWWDVGCWMVYSQLALGYELEYNLTGYLGCLTT